MIVAEQRPTQVLALLFLLILFGSFAMAQSGAGAIQDTVKDPTGAVIPAATIHAVNNATGVAVHTKTNKAGFYHAPGLFTGIYAVTIAPSGIKSPACSDMLFGFFSGMIVRDRQGDGNVKIGFIDFQGLREGGETASSFSRFSVRPTFPGPASLRVKPPELLADGVSISGQASVLSSWNVDAGG